MLVLTYHLISAGAVHSIVNMCGDLILQERLFAYTLQPYKPISTNPTAVFSMSGGILPWQTLEVCENTVGLPTAYRQVSDLRFQLTAITREADLQN
jgi:hypothetical protein